MYNGAFHSQATQIDDTLDMPIHANCLRLKNNSITVFILQYLFKFSRNPGVKYLINTVKMYNVGYHKLESKQF